MAQARDVVNLAKLSSGVAAAFTRRPEYDRPRRPPVAPARWQTSEPVYGVLGTTGLEPSLIEERCAKVDPRQDSS